MSARRPVFVSRDTAAYRRLVLAEAINKARSVRIAADPGSPDGYVFNRGVDAVVAALEDLRSEVSS